MTEQLWAVVVGGLLAVVPLTLQLVNERFQRRRERQLQLRREVYLQAADALGGSLEDFFQITRADRPLGSEPEHTRTSGSWLNKIPLVADRVTTAISFSEASAAVAAAGLDILAHRVTVAEVNDEIKVVNGEIDRIRAYQNQLKEIAKAIENEEPTPELQRRLGGLALELEKTWPLLDDAGHRVAALTSKHWAAARVLLERAVTLGIGAQRLVRRAQLAAREELEMPPFETDYLAEMERIDREMIGKLKATLEKIEKKALPDPAA